MKNRIKSSQIQMTAPRKKLWKRVKKCWVLYLFLLPCMVYVFIFDYAPLYGVQIAFRNFSPYKGIWGSPSVGLEHFVRFVESFQFWTLIKNVIILNIYNLAVSFPIPVILALILNYTTFKRFKKFAQTVTYAPHLISTVVIVGMLMAFMTPTGIINQLIGLLGMEPVLFLGKSSMFRSIYVWSDVWQHAGWGSIIYIAVLTGVNQELHEAAIVDGANKLQRVRNIDLVALLPTMTIIFIMNLGSIMNVGFEKAFLLQNDLNLEVSEIISTYVYKIGIQSAQYSYATAIGLFNNLINFILLVTVNRAARTVTGTSLW